MSEASLCCLWERLELLCFWSCFFNSMIRWYTLSASRKLPAFSFILHWSSRFLLGRHYINSSISSSGWMDLAIETSSWIPSLSIFIRERQKGAKELEEI